MDQSPIPPKKSNDVPWIHKKVEKIAGNLKSSLGVDCDTTLNSDTRDLRDILDRLKIKFHDKETSRSERIQILTVLPSHWSTNTMAETMDATKYVAKKAKELGKTKGILAMPDKKLGKLNTTTVGIEILITLAS